MYRQPWRTCPLYLTKRVLRMAGPFGGLFMGPSGVGRETLGTKENRIRRVIRSPFSKDPSQAGCTASPEDLPFVLNKASIKGGWALWLGLLMAPWGVGKFVADDS
ncbi:hypothetical protein CEXT_501561 [Caerostris extrusa]|uniref:Uncharacterized protein n=1 Tax=Caerostris extrusa TaxID=172846 RepID=A0AAV4R2V3_CAEEX|nr:hypothetical protein CEXT_501561 [Caerostris extrusa]